MKQEIIEAKQKQLQKDIAQLKKTSSQYSTIRLLLGIAIVWMLYETGRKPSIMIIAMVGILLFLIIAQKHRRMKILLEDKQTSFEVLDRILMRKGDAWKQFQDIGKDFLNERMTQAYDLDLFGPSSLFQYLNTAATIAGRNALARLLTHQKQQPEMIKQRQEAVKELIEKEDVTCMMNMLSLLFMKHAKKMNKKKMDAFLNFMVDEMKPYPLWIKILAYVLPILSIGASIAVAFFHVHMSIALASFTITLAFAMLLFMRNNADLSYVQNVHDSIQDYERMFTTLQQQAFQSELLQRYIQQLSDAQQGMKSLNQLLGFVQIRSNSILFLFVNGFFALDFHCVMALQKWKATYGAHVGLWLEAIGEIEALLSLAQLGFAKEETCFATISQDQSLVLEKIKHPLIQEEKAIANSIKLQHGSYIVTGSNMSGKTTFLRTIGINMILFQAGAPVCASSFHASPLSIYTSMRVHDNVSEGISTFYAEILRIKQMMEESKTRIPMLVLIDEIFKGTNSADRILCAKQAIVALHLPHVITMVSTHDFELCELEQDPSIQAKNYHFAEYYEGERICFDYLLKEGRCTTTNAKQLMKLAGF